MVTYYPLPIDFIKINKTPQFISIILSLRFLCRVLQIHTNFALAGVSIVTMDISKRSSIQDHMFTA